MHQPNPAARFRSRVRMAVAEEIYRNQILSANAQPLPSFTKPSGSMPPRPTGDFTKDPSGSMPPRPTGDFTKDPSGSMPSHPTGDFTKDPSDSRADVSSWALGYLQTNPLAGSNQHTPFVTSSWPSYSSHVRLGTPPATPCPTSTSTTQGALVKRHSRTARGNLVISRLYENLPPNARAWLTTVP